MLALAALPSLVLLFYIYKKDRRDKEPKKLLFGCFVFGVISILPAVTGENIGDAIIECFATEGSVLYAFLDGFFVVAISEELFKYVMLKLKTWNSHDFNCTFDGIVYAVFVSLGFATFENILYVMDGGISTALIRLFTAVPGHACDAVYMGYFYSKAKQAKLYNNKAAERKNKARALLYPIILHGIYDFLLSFEEDIVGDDIVTAGILLWIVFVIILFIVTFSLVHKASKNDMYFMAPAPNPAFILKKGNRICKCGTIGDGNFCVNCGAELPK